MKKGGFLSDIREIIILLAIVLLIRTFGFGLYHVPTCSMETTMLVGERFFGDKLTVMFTEIKRGDIVAFNAPFFKYSTNAFFRIIQEYFWGPDNWTKRVIGVPGDQVRGAIEDGKPVVYLNGVKLSEPYLNKYPIIKTWKIDMAQLQNLLQKNPMGIYTENLTSLKSFDPSIKIDDQKQSFYNIKLDRIYIDPTTQAPIVLYPGSVSLSWGDKVIKGDNYWNSGDEFSVKLDKDEYWLMGDNRLGSSDARVFGPVKRKYITARILYRIWSVDTDEAWWIWDLVKNPIDFFKRVRWGRIFQAVK